MALTPAEKYAFYGIDINSAVLGSITTYNGSFTPTEDCWCIGTMTATTSQSTHVYINNKVIAKGGSGINATVIYPVFFPVKAGQTVKTRNVSDQSYDLSFYKLLN